jgi:hypothetical protein
MCTTSTRQVITHVALGRGIYDSCVKRNDTNIESYSHNSLHGWDPVVRSLTSCATENQKELHLLLELFARTFGEG